MTQKKVFLSYSSIDGKVAKTICVALEARGHACWMSTRDVSPGENFQGAIVRAIRNAGIMVLIFSSNANNSDEIKKELALASQQKLTVIPVRVEDVLPGEDYTYELATRQWIDLFDDWEVALDRLARQIDLTLPRGPVEDVPRPIPAVAIPKPKAMRAFGAPFWVAMGLALLLVAGNVTWFLWPARHKETATKIGSKASVGTQLSTITPAQTPVAATRSVAMNSYKPRNTEPATGATRDPFDFCKLVGNADSTDEGSIRDSRYIGPMKPAEVVETLRSVVPGIGEKNVVWRCMHSAVYGCYPGTSGRACLKLGNAKTPTKLIQQYCAENPNSPHGVPNSANDTFFVWRCIGSVPARDTRVPPPAIDPRGYLKDAWQRVGPIVTAVQPGRLIPTQTEIAPEPTISGQPVIKNADGDWDALNRR